jgi:pimeloyl-ACP methyl ester carboxylesterase
VSAIRLGEHVARSYLQLSLGFRRRWVHTSGGTVHALERNGRGRLPPVMLIHGLSSSGVHYLRVARQLEAFSRVILPDLPGHGFSQMPSPLTGTRLLDGTYEALDALITEPAILSGTSLGGYVAIRYALARPEKVRGLMVAAPAGAAMEADALTELRARFTLKTHGDALKFVDALFAERTPFRHVVALGLKGYFSLPQTAAVLEQMGPAQLFTAEEVSALKPPTLFLWGDSERILPPSNLEFFRAHLPPNARIERPRGWGHGGFLDDPKGFAQRLVRFGEELVQKNGHPLH